MFYLPNCRSCREGLPGVDEAIGTSPIPGECCSGIRLFHVEVAEEKNRRGYLKFLDNCAILTVEEGLIDEEAIVENLQRIFDQNWHWQLKEMEDFKYLFRFPPHKLVASTLILDTTYFKMQKDKVLVSLKAWNGNIEPYDALEDVWVQIRGVPPK
jgi:hypothetical protein